MSEIVNEIIEGNRLLWDAAYEFFIDACALPVWGPFGVGEDLSLISDIRNKTFLEIGCGSGRSVKYLIENGAKKVYGIDFSENQIAEASKHNGEPIKKGLVQLIQCSMEQPLQIEPVDIVFSIYAIGWTQDPQKTLNNIFSSLKTGGKFVWSWDHSIFSDVEYKNGEFVVTHSYHDEIPIALPNWKRSGRDGIITYRKISSWFKLLRDAGFIVSGYHEPPPKNMLRGYDKPDKYYSVQKAEKIPSTFIFECVKP